MRTAIPIALGALLAAVAALGCGPGEDCKQLCDVLVDDCAMRAWTSSGQCADGCDDELFRHPQRLQVIDCYQEAADTCDIEGLIACRHLGDRLGVEASDD